MEDFTRRYGDAWASADSDAFVAFFAPNAVYRDDQMTCASDGRIASVADYHDTGAVQRQLAAAA